MNSLPLELKDIRIRRGGIIPYIKLNRQTLFLFGISEIHAYISDFGGTRDDTDNDIIETALREYNEETFGCLIDIKREDIIKSKYIIGPTGYHGDEICVLFLIQFPKTIPLFSKISEFRDRNVPGDETKGLAILNSRQLNIALKRSNERIEGTRLFFFHPKVRPILKKEIKTILSL